MLVYEILNIKFKKMKAYSSHPKNCQAYKKARKNSPITRITIPWERDTEVEVERLEQLLSIVYILGKGERKHNKRGGVSQRSQIRRVKTTLQPLNGEVTEQNIK